MCAFILVRVSSPFVLLILVDEVVDEVEVEVILVFMLTAGDGLEEGERVRCRL